MNPVPHFSASYAEARRKFVAATRARGLAVETHLLPERVGADGEPLATDVAVLGPQEAQGILIVTSATHGVEGYCGSAIQTGLLSLGLPERIRADAGVAVMHVHAANPYGFSHSRRVTQENVDLNRNFVDFSAPLPVNTDYADVHDLLLPETWPTRST